MAIGGGDQGRGWEITRRAWRVSTNRVKCGWPLLAYHHHSNHRTTPFHPSVHPPSACSSIGLPVLPPEYSPAAHLLFCVPACLPARTFTSSVLAPVSILVAHLGIYHDAGLCACPTKANNRVLMRLAFYPLRHFQLPCCSTAHPRISSGPTRHVPTV